jgi:hypothetical protein
MHIKRCSNTGVRNRGTARFYDWFKQLSLIGSRSGESPTRTKSSRCKVVWNDSFGEEVEKPLVRLLVILLRYSYRTTGKMNPISAIRGWQTRRQVACDFPKLYKGFPYKSLCISVGPL